MTARKAISTPTPQPFHSKASPSFSQRRQKLHKLSSRAFPAFVPLEALQSCQLILHKGDNVTAEHFKQSTQ
jgi:hypothetical protein